MTYTTSLNRDFSQSVMNADHLLNDTVDWIRDHLTPEDVYDQSVLEEWALNNGFIVGE